MENKLVVITKDELRNLIEETVKAAFASELPKKKERVLITRYQASKMLGCSIGTIDNYLKKGLLSRLRIGDHAVRIDKSQVDSLVRSREV